MYSQMEECSLMIQDRSVMAYSKVLSQWLPGDWEKPPKLLLALTSTVILGSESHRTHDPVLISDGSRNLQSNSSSAHLKVKFMSRLMGHLPVCLGVKPPSGGQDQIFITVRQSSLIRGRCVIYNCCWLSPAQSFWGLSPMELMTVFYCLMFQTPLTLEGQVPVFISPRNRVTQLYPQAPTALQVKVKVMLWLTVSQPASQPVSLGVKPHLVSNTRVLLLS
jgi:hypothetical protein